MFSIYSPEGRTFLGTLEELRRIRKTPAYPRTPAKTQSEEHFADHSDSGDGDSVPPKKAISEYNKLLEKAGEREPALHAYQVMSKNVKVVLKDWPLSQALSAFQRYPFQVLPIVSPSGELLGSFSRRAFYEYVFEVERKSLDSTRVLDVFLTPESYVYSAEPVTDVRRIASVLVENKLDAMPVTASSGIILGIVSRTDLLKCLVMEPPLSLWC